MKKVILSLFAVLALSFCAMAENGDAYTVDDNAIEQVFAQAGEVQMTDASFLTEMTGMETAAYESAASVNPWAAWAICWFLGEFGIHRHYMGTSKPMWLYYTLTCGGIFGIVYAVDWVVLLVGAIQNDISEYCGNDKFIMWL